MTTIHFGEQPLEQSHQQQGGETCRNQESFHWKGKKNYNTERPGGTVIHSSSNETQTMDTLVGL